MVAAKAHDRAPIGLARIGQVRVLKRCRKRSVRLYPFGLVELAFGRGTFRQKRVKFRRPDRWDMSGVLPLRSS